MQALGPGDLHIMVAMASQQAGESIRDVLMMQRVARVFIAPNNREAVAEMQVRDFNLVIIDQDFPDLGGADFCRFLRLTSGPLSVAPIVYGIAAPDRAKVITARDMGATKIVSLPFTGATLIKAVQDAIADTRPIIQTSAYNGPDRRQRDTGGYAGPERRVSTPNQISYAARHKILKSVE